MEQVISVLLQFFDRELPRLGISYNWKIPEIKGFSKSGECGYEPNRELKIFLKRQWDGALTESTKIEVAETIVKDWGGVRNNSAETIKGYVSVVGNPSATMPLKGVASYSKIFAIVHPDEFAIYDARVAACLNAVQINAGLSAGLAFNYVPGRNNIVGNSLKRVGFTQERRFSVEKLLQRGWSGLELNKTYLKYMNVLKLCLICRPQYDLVQLEMSLFANAEIECKKAMKRPDWTDLPL